MTIYKVYTYNISMKLRTLYLTEAQVKILKEIGEVSVSEHIRRAIDDYIALKKTLLISKSKS